MLVAKQASTMSCPGYVCTQFLNVTIYASNHTKSQYSQSGTK